MIRPCCSCSKKLFGVDVAQDVSKKIALALMIGLYVCLQNIYGGNNNVGIDDQEQESTILILKPAWAAILGNRHDRRKERYDT